MTNPERVYVKRPIVAAILLALALLAGVLLAFWKVPLETHLQPSNAPSPAPTPTSQIAPPSPTSPLVPTQMPVGRVTNVIVGGGAQPLGTFVLAGDYAYTYEVHAADELCSTVVTAVDASYDGDYRNYLAGNGPAVDFIGFTFDASGSGSTTGMKFFRPGTYRFVAGAYPPLGPPEGNGTAALCEDWTIHLQAR
jgi:hypothetical protein